MFCMYKESEILPRRTFSIREAASLGVGRAQLASMVRSGELRRLMAGVYAPVDAEVSLGGEGKRRRCRSRKRTASS